MRGNASAFLAMLCIVGATTAVAQQTARNIDSANDGSARADDDGLQYVFTRLAAFEIPYDSARAAAEGASAVQLLVSVDQGAQWHLYATQRPDVQRFQVRVARDGEYWFASRLILADKRAVPESPQPELKVVVDSSQPTVRLTASVSTSGRVTAQWQVTDANPDPRQVVLEYRGVNESVWRAVDIAGAVAADASGKVEFMPDETSPRVNVRVRVADKAKNVADSEKQLLVSLFASPSRGPLASTEKAPPPQDPFTSHRRKHPDATAWPDDAAEHLQQQATNVPNAADWRANDVTPGDSKLPAQEASTSTASDRAKTPTGVAPDDVSSAESGGEAPSQDRSAYGGGSYVQGGGSAGDAETLEDEPATSITELTKAPPQRSPIAPPVANRVDAADQTSETSRDDSTFPAAPAEPGRGAEPGAFSPVEQTSPLPPGEQALMVNRKVFPLAYDVESVGPSGVKNVRLWGTKDGGRTWHEWGGDADLRSPIDVEVGGDGVYGFRVVAENRDGLKGETPKPGSPADIWVQVDTAAPQVRITAAPYGVGENAGLLDIQWEAEDANLGDRAVTILFAESPGGRWSTIAAGLPNTGHYNWRVGANVPRQVYLRLEVRDLGGNLGVHQLTEPISVAGLRPKARIRGVLPIDQTPRGAQMLRQYR
ncbi:MAG: hypothetical protein RIC55_23400 [Pirellulaceae bacterium]